MDEKLALSLISLSKKIAIVSPLRYISQDGERKLYSIDTARVPRAGTDNYIYVYEFTKGEDIFYEDHIIFRKVIMEDFTNATCVLSLYTFLKERPLEDLSLKAMMKGSGIKDFYKVRKIFDRLVEIGLVIPLGGISKSERDIYLTYFYHGDDPNVLIVRHLLSLGFRVKYEMVGRVILFQAERLDERFSVCYGENEAQLALLGLDEGTKCILVSEKSHTIHFKRIVNLTLREFLGSICPGS